MGKKLDLTGQRFGRLVALESAQNRGECSITCWKCLCDCGNEKDIASRDLRNGDTKSCGCLKEEIIGINHGMSHIKTYRI